MKFTKKKIFKATNSTTADNSLANGVIIEKGVEGVNNNTQIMANLMTQSQSTKLIAIIAIVGILAFVFYKKK